MLNSTTRHILSLSGGKDSTALAIHMRDRVPQMEYVFCDTKKELPETYEYLHKIEAYLGRKIVRLCADRGFDHWLDVFGHVLPSSQMRWCTKLLKIKPFESYVGDDSVMMYIGIRADEMRQAYISSKPNIKAVYPLKDDGITRDDVFRILEDSGVGLPEYYKWRTRSGCYFCFFQRRAEWVGLLEHHPELFQDAQRYEKYDADTGRSYTWNQRESLGELAEEDRVAEIKERHRQAMRREKVSQANQPLIHVLSDVLDDEDDEEPCLFCQT